MDSLSDDLLDLIYQFIGSTFYDFIEKCRLRSVCKTFRDKEIHLPRLCNSTFSIPLFAVARLKHYCSSEYFHVYDACDKQSRKVGCHPFYLVDLDLKKYPSAKYFWPEERVIWTSRLGKKSKHRHRRSLTGIALCEQVWNPHSCETEDEAKDAQLVCEDAIGKNEENVRLLSDAFSNDQLKLASHPETYEYSRGTRENNLFDIQCVMDAVSRSLGSLKELKVSGRLDLTMTDRGNYRAASENHCTLSCMQLSERVVSSSLQHLELSDAFVHDIQHLFEAASSSNLIVFTLTDVLIPEDAYDGAIGMVSGWSQRKDATIRSFVIQGRRSSPLRKETFCGVVAAMKGIQNDALTEVSGTSYCSDFVYVECATISEESWKEAISLPPASLMAIFSARTPCPHDVKRQGRKEQIAPHPKKKKLRRNAELKDLDESGGELGGELGELNELLNQKGTGDLPVPPLHDEVSSQGDASHGIARKQRVYKNAKKERDRYMWQDEDYRCKHCGFVWPKHSVIVSFRQTAVSNCITRKKSCSAWKEAHDVEEGGLFLTETHIVGNPRGVQLTPPREYVLACDAKGFKVGVNPVTAEYEVFNAARKLVLSCSVSTPRVPHIGGVYGE